MSRRFKLNKNTAFKDVVAKIKEIMQSGATKKTLNVLGRSILTIFLIFVLTACILAASLTIYIMKFVDTEADLAIDKESLNYTSIVYAMNKDGEYVETERVWAGENRIWVDYDQIPQYMTDAVVAVEDKRFDTHNGVDWGRTIFAFVFFIKVANILIFSASIKVPLLISR